jgi:hypothetical protein
MTKFNELSILDLHSIVNQIDMIFNMYDIDINSRNAFWECVDIGNKKFNMV